ncbi:MAG: M28 family peptidase [Cocleimonas sp.]
MSQSLSSRLIRKLIDWLIAFCGATLFLWFITTQPVFINEYSSSTSSVDTQELKKHVQLLTGGYAPRTLDSGNLNNTADYIYRQFSSVGSPEYQTINTISQQYYNVFLKLGPDTEELYVVGAHYDAEDDSIDTEGNASGVATLIELARNLAENSNKLKIGVVLVAYPLSLNQTDNMVNTGSYFHASSLKNNNKNVRLMVSLDSVGQLKLQNNEQVHPYKFMDFLYPQEDDTINLVGRLQDFSNIRELKKGFNSNSSLSLNTHNLLETFNKRQSSDHVSYWNQGYPAVLISDKSNYKGYGRVKIERSSVQLTDRLDYEKMAMLVNGLFQVVIQVETKDEDKTHLAQGSLYNRAKSLLY